MKYNIAMQDPDTGDYPTSQKDDFYEKVIGEQENFALSAVRGFFEGGNFNEPSPHCNCVDEECDSCEKRQHWQNYIILQVATSEDGGILYDIAFRNFHSTKKARSEYDVDEIMKLVTPKDEINALRSLKLAIEEKLYEILD